MQSLWRADVLLLHLLDLFRLFLCSQLICPLFQRLLVLLAVTVEAAHHSVLKLPLEVLLFVLEALHPPLLAFATTLDTATGFIFASCWRIWTPSLQVALTSKSATTSTKDFASTSRAIDRARAPRGLGARELRSDKRDSPPARNGLSPAVGATLRSAVCSSRNRPGG